jgi:3',5'-cyclic AMP phosphodiesterase CpdA
MPDASQAITILHLSDTQFGRNHRFGRLGLPPPDDQFDSLLKRLPQDLDLLRDDHGLEPQMVVCSGDLAEWALPREFADFAQFLTRLIEHLHLSRDRVVLVPGTLASSRWCRS